MVRQRTNEKRGRTNERGTSVQGRRYGTFYPQARHQCVAATGGRGGKRRELGDGFLRPLRGLAIRPDARSHDLRMPCSGFDTPSPFPALFFSPGSTFSLPPPSAAPAAHLISAAPPAAPAPAPAPAPAMASALHLSSVFHLSPCSLTPPHPSVLSNSSNSSSSASGAMRNAAAPCPEQRHAAAAAAAASPGLSCCASAFDPSDAPVMSRRQLSVATLLVSTFGAVAGARADADEDYKRETSEVIDQVRTTLALEKTDPNKAAAVAKLRQAGNEWVAKYRKAKKVAGKPSFSNIYSVINAISGHFVSFGAAYPIPAKRKDRILDEVKDAEKALSRGR